ncbi:MAG TPA: C4-dicarboxylate ABC transporter [Alphaproteobacteria bacterium]|nr:C4-dicarboxylate ABC transporter [Alphaproteobacteria bacterium]
MIGEFADALPILMFVALAILLFSGYPVAFILGGIGLAFGLIGIAFDIFNYRQFYLISLRIFGGSMENIVLVAIPMFIFMGTMMERTGVARDLLNALQILTRRMPGGLALSVTLMGVILAATTGIIGASVVMITLMALPVMLERRYHVPLATGTISAAGTLGILIPPSIMLVIMAELLSIPVGTTFLAAIGPGLLLAGLYALYIVATALIRPQHAPAMPRIAANSGTARRGEITLLLLRSFIPPVLLITLVLGSIFAGFATPTEASGVGALGAVLLAVLNRRLNWPMLREVAEESALTGAMLFGIFVGATCFSYVFRALGGEDLILDAIAATGAGPWGILFVLMAVVFLLGFFFDWIEITLIILPVFAPIIAELDFSAHVGAQALIVPWFAILIAVNLQTSFLTPPFGFALFYLKGVAPAHIRIGEIYRGIVPFVILQLVGLGLVIGFPEIALWLPAQVLQ